MTHKPRILITGATGQVGSKTINYLTGYTDIEIVAAVRSTKKAVPFHDRGISTVILDFDDESTYEAAFKDIERVFIVTGYTVDMLRQSKAIVDAAKVAGVKHIVHLGACGRDNTTVAHWAWHQLVERYIEWSGFSFTHLRPETFMQNLLSYDGTSVIKHGIIQHYVKDARKSWVDVNDVAAVAAQALLKPQIHNGKTYRLGYDAKSYYDIADMLTEAIGKTFKYVPHPPEEFLRIMKAKKADMAYMECVYKHYIRYAEGTIPGADDVFDNFRDITGYEPTHWADFIEKHKEEFKY
jgi:uncharacterized protein YbjT (DUF2867 family)